LDNASAGALAHMLAGATVDKIASPGRKNSILVTGAGSLGTGLVRAAVRLPLLDFPDPLQEGRIAVIWLRCCCRCLDDEEN